MFPPPAGQNAVQEELKVVIQNVSFIIRTKKLADAAEIFICKLLLQRIYGYFITKFRSRT